MNRFIRLLVSFSLMNSSLTHGMPSPGSIPPKNPSAIGATDAENGPNANSFAIGLETALKSGQRPADPFHLVDQELTIQGQKIPLYTLGESPLLPRFDQMEYLIEKEGFSVIGKFKGKEVIRHTFKGLGIHSYQADAEILFAATREGQLHAIDMVYMQKNIFRGPIPVYKNLISSEDFRQPMRLNFWTRGLPPRLFENIEDSAQSLFPHNRDGKLTFQAGDLVLHRGPENQSKAFAVLSREVLTRHVREKAEELTLRASLTSSDVFASMDPSALTAIEARIDMEITADDLSQMALRSIPSQSVNKLLAQAQRLTDTTQLYDRATLSDWKTSYELMRTQAEKNKKNLDGGDDLSGGWQELLAAAMKNNQNFTKKPGFFKKYAFSLALLTGAVTAGGFSHVYEAQPVMLALDYLYANAVPPILKVAEYRYPLLSSVVSLMSIIPLVQTVAWMAPSSMKTIALGLQGVSAKLSTKMYALAAQWQSLDLWQRIVTSGARVYSLISVAAWNHLGSILRQPQLFRTLKMGLNPFMNIPKTSELGESINLEKDLSLGVNNPFLKKEKLNQINIKQQQAMQYLTQENLRARHLAFQLVALTLYQNQDVDPATLAMFLQESKTSENIDASMLKDLNPEKQKEWLALTEVIANDWIQTVQSEGRLFANLPADEFLAMYRTAKEKVDRYKNSSILKKRLTVFKDRTNRLLKKMKQDALLLGVSDGQLLRTVYANKFVADQVKKTFVSDHILVVGLPAFWGDRANPDKATIPAGNADGTDRNLLTFKPEGGSIADFWTNPEHMMDVWLNVSAHFFGGGARTILLYQGEPPVQETNYKPAEHFLLQQNHEQESALKGSTEWVKNTLDTRKSALGDYYMKSLVRQIRTVQAGLLLSLTFRFIATDPTLDHALMGWYLFFVAGTWSYAWPWTIIGQGNNLEEQRLSEKADRLLELQTKLSQSLRLADESAISESAEQLRALYESSPKREQLLLKAIGETPQSSDSVGYQKWSARLLEYSQQTPPYATRPNPLPSWISTWAGALSTTFLAIPLGILSLDPHYMTVPNLAIETAKAGGLYAGAYLLIGKEGLWSQALNKMDWLKATIKEKRAQIKNGVLMCRQFRY